ncbi:hypothetical protein KSF_108900 [Reticulibacter mediterranei]|uniref:Baseplate protein J-like barrel domain-containing protein n=1 Tax=Reticulibacter mediterranei TaxID=2778369 RepID=A0A8J3J1W7_9CHLR|nr:baseplate J/gp47 family protein [Reticulibacter mediterranei]GHP00843.1 hypothetical protein KSF_108900 [Reticulibacter mediterranei]
MAITAPRMRKKESLLPSPVPVEQLGKQKKQRWLHHPKSLSRVIVFVCAILILALVSIGVVWSIPPVHATITVTPQQQIVAEDILLQTTTSMPNTSQLQTHMVTMHSSPRQVTTSATGSTHIPAQKARGVMTFFNANTAATTLTAGTLITASNGVQIITLAPVTVPPVTLNDGIMGQATVLAQAVQTGARGNIPARAINNVLCCAAHISAMNYQSFSGGQDAVTAATVTQHDIDTAAAPVIRQESMATRSALIARVHAPDQLVEASLACQPSVQAYPAAGEQGTHTSMTITVSCLAQAFNSALARQLARQQLKGPGLPYRLIGTPTTGSIHTSLNQQGIVDVIVPTRGQFVYQLDRAVLQSLISKLAGTEQHKAQTLLEKQPGVGTVRISGLVGTTLPTDVRQISIQVDLHNAS